MVDENPTTSDVAWQYGIEAMKRAPLREGRQSAFYGVSGADL
mgnify:CR=1 FL=1